MLPDAVKKRVDLVQRILSGRLVRLALTAWVVLGAYDLFLSQLIPERLGGRFPRARDALALTGNWLSFQAWLLILAGIVVVGSIEFAHRRTSLLTSEAKELLDAVCEEPVPPGMLDLVVDGMNAFDDITSVNVEMLKEANRLTRFMRRYTFIIKYISSPRARRRMSISMANKIDRFSSRFRPWSERLKKSSDTAETSCKFMIDSASLNSESEIEVFVNFHSVILASLHAVAELRNSAEESQASIAAMVGISRDLNLASGRYQRSIGEFGDQLTSLIAGMGRIDQVWQEKAKKHGIPALHEV